VLLSCKNDDDFNPPAPDNFVEVAITDEQFATANFGASIQANFIGRIVNEAGNKLKDVQVTIGNQTVMTDHNGVFVLNSASVHEKFAFIKATKNGYIQGSRALIPTPNGTNDVRITLIEKNIVATVNSGEASEASLPNGGKVSFQGDFIDASGNPYNGQVQVSLHYLEPNQEATFTQMPGMLFGKRSDGSSSAMETYGMLGVNLYATNGEELNIAASSPASIEFPVATSTPNAPEAIPLWYFDEAVGYWKEQGVANRIGNKYIAEVSHFTWWNCDLPLDSVNVCFELRSHGILPNFHFEIIRDETNQIIFSGETNDLGYECGLFPKDEAVTINIYSDCSNEVIYMEALGPYSSDATIEVIVPDLPTELVETVLSGVVSTCTGASVTNGYAFLYKTNSFNFNNFEVISIVNGAFNHPYGYCEGQEYGMIVYDLDSGQSSDVTGLFFQPNETNLGNILVCGNQVGGVFNGDVTLLTQQGVELFGLFGYSKISGDLLIGENFQSTNITNLDLLTSIESVVGKLRIVGNPVLTSLEGLNNLNDVGSLEMIVNIELENLLGLRGLSNVGDVISIQMCHSLINLEGLNGITHINNSLIVSANSSLQNLKGLENVSSISPEGSVMFQSNSSLQSITDLYIQTNEIKHFEINGNPLLSDINIFSNIERIGNLSIVGDNMITDFSMFSSLSNIEWYLTIWHTNFENLSVFSNLVSIGEGIKVINNTSMISLDGVENLLEVGSIEIGIDSQGSSKPNVNLTDYCALTNLITNGTYGEVTIENNAYNPTVQDIIDGNCSQ